jgi:hypothetical protein
LDLPYKYIKIDLKSEEKNEFFLRKELNSDEKAQKMMIFTNVFMFQQTFEIE